MVGSLVVGSRVVGSRVVGSTELAHLGDVECSEHNVRHTLHIDESDRELGKGD